MTQQLQRVRSSRRERGQIAPVALFGVLIASAVLVLMFNTGQQVTEKSLVANAADAAAYSGAVWTARHLNFLAYTNRAMVANHAAVGHFVSYVSWIRYVHDSIEYVDRITQWIPYVGQYVDYVERVAQQVRRGTEQSARAAVPAIDGWNANLRAAQLEIQASLALQQMDALMSQTAQAYDPRIRINDRAELDRLPSEVRALVDARLLSQATAVPRFIARQAPNTDRNSVSELICASARSQPDTQRWMVGERGWRENLFVAQIRKRGSTTHWQRDNGADWQAVDDLQYRTRGVFGWRSWRRLADETSHASAREFARNYAGVNRYYNVSGAPADRTLRVIAIATLRQSQVRTAALLGMSTTDRPLAVASFAKVDFRRPSGAAFNALGANRREYSNLFNPFWEAKLAPADLGLGL